jgi:hypothetical protein
MHGAVSTLTGVCRRVTYLPQRQMQGAVSTLTGDLQAGCLFASTTDECSSKYIGCLFASTTDECRSKYINWGFAGGLLIRL